MEAKKRGRKRANPSSSSSEAGGGGRGGDRGSGRKSRAPNAAFDAELDRPSHAPPADEATLSKYVRGEGNLTSKQSFKDRRVRTTIRRQEVKYAQASQRAAQAEIALPEDAGYLEAEGMEKTHRFKQKDIKEHLDLNTAHNVFDLSLPDLGPYCIDYTRNGRFLILGGRRGHLAMLDALRMDVLMEVQLKETIRDVRALHNENFVAVAQKKYVYIYDSQGAEVHCLRKHQEPYRLEFLPYHFLLASVGRTGYLKYQDISTGQLVSELRTGLGICDCLKQNPSSAVLHAGHSNGVVTMWAPTMPKPLVRMLCHQGPVTALGVDRGGNYMATAGKDGQTKVWDLRTFKELHGYLSPKAPTSLDISDSGMLALGYGPHVQVWRDALSVKAKAPYLTHQVTGGAAGSNDIHRAVFRPLEDSLGLGHGGGFSSMVVPGAGEANFDTFEANPFQSRLQRRETEVRSLIEKLQPETIVLRQDSFIGGVDDDPNMLQDEMRQIAEEADTRPKKEKKEKKKMRGKSKIGKKLGRKQKNVVDEGTVKLRAKQKAERERAAKQQQQQQGQGQAGGQQQEKEEGGKGWQQREEGSTLSSKGKGKALPEGAPTALAHFYGGGGS